jgi:SAM-dependent methyltransferase
MEANNERIMVDVNKKDRDFLGFQLRDMPYFRAVLRAVESRFYQDYDLPAPVLDLGCGDGHFATIAFDHLLDVGIDPWSGPVQEAGQRGSYHLAVQGYGDQLPFPDAYFASAVSNSVLEHIPELDPVLKEMNRVLKPGSMFLFCVPSHHFLSNLSISNFLDQIGLDGLADSYRAFFNRISRHHHCDSPDVWQARLEKTGFKIEKWWHYFSPEALHILEWGHYFGLPSWIIHAVFKRWILVRSSWNLALTRAVVRKAYDESPSHARGSYTFYIVRKI